jgi:uracil-DNA glycosylase family 4
LARLADEIVDCRLCPRLVEWREAVAADPRAAYRDQTYWGRPIVGFGDPDARVMVLGLAPGAHGANRTGRVFTGDRSGDWLYRAMHRAGLANQAESIDRDDGLALVDAWVTSTVRCAPPDNKPTTVERDTCRPYLRREIDLLDRLRVVVALGGFAHEAACEEFAVRPRPKFGHGVESVSESGVVVIGSYHPSQQNTFTGRLTEEMLDAVFARAAALVRST